MTDFTDTEELFDDKEILLELLEEQHKFGNKFAKIFSQLDRADKFEVMGKLQKSDLSIDIVDIITSFIESIYRDLKSLVNVRMELIKRPKSNYHLYLYDIKLGMFGSLNTGFIDISLGRGMQAHLSSEYFLTSYLQYLNKLNMLINKMNKTREQIIESNGALFGNTKKHIDNYKKFFKMFIDTEYEFKLFLMETSKVVTIVNEYLGTELDTNLNVSGIIKLNSEGVFTNDLPDIHKDLTMTYNSSAVDKIKALGYETEIFENSYDYTLKSSYPNGDLKIKQFKLHGNYINVINAEIDILTELILPRREFTDFDNELEQMREYRFNNKNPINIKFV